MYFSKYEIKESGTLGDINEALSGSGVVHVS